MRVAIVGTGYVGLVTGAGLAECGHRVVCIDVDPRKVAGINRAEPPIFEVGLEELLIRHAGQALSATTDLAAAVAGADVTFICVGTPSMPDGAIDTTALRAAAVAVGGAFDPAAEFPVVVVKSTVVPGTTVSVVLPALEATSGRRCGVDLGVGVNPEFLTEGQAVADFLGPDRLVLGGDDNTVEILRRLYSPLVGVPVVATNMPTAEMIKYASNALLATAISFANEIANLGAAVGDIDVVDVMRGVHLSRYLTSQMERAPEAPVTAGLSHFLEAGCGYGGSCLPKDVAALRARGSELGVDTVLLDAVAAVNRRQPQVLVDLLRRRLGDLRHRKVAVLGLAFKPDTDDVRCSPAWPVIDLLLGAGAEVVAHDPVVEPAALGAYRGQAVVHCSDLALAVKDADAVVIVTRWPLYQTLPDLLAGRAEQPLVVDGRRSLEPGSVAEYAGIGWEPF